MLLENTCFRSSPALSSGKHKRVLWIFSEQTGLSLLATTAGTAFSATLTPRPTMSQASCLTISTGRYQKMVCQQVHLHQTAHPVPILIYSPAVWCGALKFPNASSYNQFKPSRLLATRLACTDNIVACWLDVYGGTTFEAPETDPKVLEWLEDIIDGRTCKRTHRSPLLCVV